MQMPSLRNRTPAKRSKVVRVAPGQTKPTKIQIFQKKKVKEPPKPPKEEQRLSLLELTKAKLEKDQLEKQKKALELKEIETKNLVKGGMLSGLNVEKTKTPLHKYSELFKFDSDYKSSKQKRTSQSALEKQRMKYKAINNFFSTEDDRVGLFTDKGDYVSLADRRDTELEDSDEEPVTLPYAIYNRK